MNPLNCKEVSALQATGDLRPLTLWERANVVFHRGICFICRKYERQLKAIGGAFRGHIQSKTTSPEAKAFKKRLIHDLTR
jgi:hypothetical protein